MKFNNSELTECWNKVSSTFTTFQQNLNEMSEDIKTIEEMLATNSICKPYYWPYEFLRDNQGHRYASYIAWTKVKGKYRLATFNSYSSPGEISDHEWDSMSITPLIESKVDKRLEAYPHLKLFLESFSENLQKKPMEEIPF